MMNTMLSKATKSNVFIFPYWKGEKKDGGELERDYRICVKNSVNNWF